MDGPDVEDLIDDYIDDYEDIPPEIEYVPDDIVEDENVSAAATPEISVEVSVPPPTSTEEETNHEHDSLDDTSHHDGGEANDLEGVLGYRHRQNNENHLYGFERYKRNKDWRRVPQSPNSNLCKVDKWKTETSTRRNIFCQGRSKKVSPESQLLDLLKKRQHDNLQTISMKHSHSVMSSPNVGVSVMPMTTGEGTRVFIRLRKDEGEEKTHNRQQRTVPNNCVLGVSMRELKRKADYIRLRPKRYTSRYENGSNHQVDEQLWVDKHAPSSFPHLLSDERTNREVLRALRAWDPYVFGRDPPKRPQGFIHFSNNAETNESKTDGQTEKKNDLRPDERNRVILLSGPPGVGKTTLAHIVARHAGYRPLEVNASDERSTSVLTERVVRAMESNTMKLNNSNQGDYGRPNCLILDEIDGADAKGAINALVEIIRSELPSKDKNNNSNKKGGKKSRQKKCLRRPIIFICNHKYAPALRPLLPFARHFDVNPPIPARLVTRLKSILNNEKYSLTSAGSLLHQLVVSTGGDIRSCLFTLQFAAARSRDNTDFSQALSASLSGTGMKDHRTDIGTTLRCVFRNVKRRTTSLMTGRGSRQGLSRVMEVMEGLGDDSMAVDSIFINLPRVSYIDPTLDRCAAAHEWLSEADLLRSDKLGLQMEQYSMQRKFFPSVAGAIHLLCRVEMKSNLSFSIREMSDVHFQRQGNLGLIQKFSEGLPPTAKNYKCNTVLSIEVIPLVLWILSAGNGSSILSRAASSIDILSDDDREIVAVHVNKLLSLGLNYTVQEDIRTTTKWTKNRSNLEDATSGGMIRLEPPIDRLTQFVHFQPPQRKCVSPRMMELVAQEVRLEAFRRVSEMSIVQHHHSTSTSTKKMGRNNKFDSIQTLVKKPNSNNDTIITTKGLASSPTVSKNAAAADDEEGSKRKSSPSKIEDLAMTVRLPKKAKLSKVESTKVNFLGIGAKRAREARSARKAAAAGLERKSKNNKSAHSGSGLLLSKVVRLRYVKGFTQAVRTPCRLQDLE